MKKKDRLMSMLERVRKKFSNLSIMSVWMTAFFITILICVAGMFIGYSYISGSTNRLIEKFNYDLMREQIKSVENCIDNILNGLDNITAMSNFDKVIRSSEFNTPENRYDVNELNKKMSAMQISGITASKKFIYIPEQDIMIGNGVATSGRIFYSMNAMQGEYGRWRSAFMASENQLEYDAENDMLLFKRSVYGGLAIVLIAIERTVFFSILEEVYDNDFVIYDTESGFCFSASGEAYSEIANSLDYRFNPMQKFDGDYSICYQSAMGYNWNYISLMNTKQSMASRTKGRNIMLVCATGSLLAGIAVGFIFIRRNNRNIYDIYNEIADAEENEIRNEYVYIQNTIRKLTKQNSQTEHLLYLHEQRLQGELLRKVITDENASAGTVAMLEECGVRLGRKYALLAEMVIYDCKFLFFEQGEDTSENYGVAKTVLKNVYSDLFTNTAEVYFSENGRNSVLMLILEDSRKSKEIEIRGIIKTAKKLIEKKFNIGFRIYLSEPRKTETGLAECYRDIIRIRDYRSANEEWIIDADCIRDKMTKNGYFFYYLPVETELRIVKFIRQKQPETIIDSIDQVFRQNEQNGTPFRLMKMLAMNITNIVIKETRVPDKNVEDYFILFSDLYEHVSRSESLEEIKTEIGRVVKFVCSQNSDEEKYGIIDEIKDYVSSNYSDSELNVNSVAERFCIKLSTLSSAFKKQEGIGLLEYITDIRIEAAKNLIMTTNEPISVIAERVGYTNERTFYRIFEKRVGTKPGEFRKKTI